MSFERFMELALYHPTLGYYAADHARIGGERGDFFTSVTTGPVLGRVLAAQCAEIWERLGAPSKICLVEHGANDGLLLRDILEESQNQLPSFYAALDTLIVEPFDHLQRKQAATLQGFNIQWVRDASEISPSAAIHFANELIDALPVALLEWNGRSWREKRVICSEEGLAFAESLFEAPERISLTKNWPTPPTAPFLAEVCPAAETWLQATAQTIERGAILLADYGWERNAFFLPHRSEGTLRGYSKHQLVRNVLETPGEIDLTAHVDFTALTQAAERSGFENAGLADQHHFLVSAGAGLLRRLETEPDSALKQKTLRNFAHLVHPETMGRAFKFACFTKGLPAEPRLSGFRFPHRQARL